MSNLTNLSERVDRETIVVTTLGELRKALHYARLGPHVLSEVRDCLDGEGLGYFPVDLIDSNPRPRKEQMVRIYRRNVGVGKAIQAVTNPSPGGDDELIQMNNNNDSNVLNEIQVIVSL